DASKPEQGKRLSGSGMIAAENRVMLVDPKTGKPCASDRVGEIWVSGPSVTTGYWRRPAETDDAVRSGLIGDETFLRTGDLGFLKDGELFVTGRLKDMIILGGRNVYPQDIEWTVKRCHPALRLAGAAAFAFDSGGEEQLAVVQEIERNPDQHVISEAIA